MYILFLSNANILFNLNENDYLTKTHFHIKGFAPGLIWLMKAKRKTEITYQLWFKCHSRIGWLTWRSIRSLGVLSLYLIHQQWCINTIYSIEEHISRCHAISVKQKCFIFYLQFFCSVFHVLQASAINFSSKVIVVWNDLVFNTGCRTQIL